MAAERHFEGWAAAYDRLLRKAVIATGELTSSQPIIFHQAAHSESALRTDALRFDDPVVRTRFKLANANFD
jgi:hypothetical protein